MGNKNITTKIPALTVYDEEDKCFISVVTIPKELQKYIIGKDGKTIKKLQEMNKVKILINDEQCRITSNAKKKNLNTILQASNLLEEYGWFYEENTFVEKFVKDIGDVDIKYDEFKE
jgi:polyribonucleotide nucleotidyltransferase